MPRRIQPIYTCFKNFPKEMVDEVIKNLNEEEQRILRDRYGNDFNSPKLCNEIKKEDSEFFYKVLYYKILRCLNTLKNGTDEKKQKRIKTIYELLIGYSKEEINEEIAKLSDSQKEIIRIRYGDDLNNPVTKRNLTKKELTALYSAIIPKIIIKLSKKKSGEIKEEMIEKSQDKSIESLDMGEQPKISQTLEIDLKTQSEPTNQKEEKSTNSLTTKEGLNEMLEIISKPSFTTLLEKLTPKEAIIFSLRLGITGKAYKANDISEFLGIDIQDVNDTTKKAIRIFQDNFDILLKKEREKVQKIKLSMKK